MADGLDTGLVGGVFRLQTGLLRLDLRQLPEVGLELVPAVPHGFQTVLNGGKGLGHGVPDGGFLSAADGGLGAVDLAPGGGQLPCRVVQLLRNGVGQPPGQIIQLLLAEDHMELMLDRTADGDTGHAGDALQLGGQGIRDKVGQLRDVLAVVGQGRHLHRQHGGVHFQHIGVAHGVAPGALQLVDLLLDIHADGVHVHPVLKLQHHHGHAVHGAGGDVFDAVQGGHGLLQGLGDIGLHGLGAGPGVGGHQDHIREIHIGHQVGGHLQIGHHPQYQNRQHRHEHGQRLFYAEFGHSRIAPCAL